MRLFLRGLLSISIVASFISCKSNKVEENLLSSDLVLIYDEPAKAWTEALPIGNGRLGAMIYGNPLNEHIQLNENTLYSGEPTSTYKGTNIQPTYNKVTGLINEEKYAEAQDIMAKNWLGRLHQSFQPFGDLFLEFQGDSVTNFQRCLDIQKSISTVSYRSKNVNYKRDVLASYPDDVIALKISADKIGELSFRAFFQSPHPIETFLEGNTLVLKGQAPGFVVRRTLENIESNGDQYKYPELYAKDGTRKPFAKQVLYGDEVDGKGMFFEARLEIRNDGGQLKETKNGVSISNANEVVMLLSMATSFNGFDKSPSKEGKDPSIINKTILSKINNKNFKEIKTAHQKDYESLFNRVQLTLETAQGNRIKDLFTDERLRNYATKPDIGLNTLLFQYGRYLMISGSRKGGQPLNLQGIWNDKVIPSWNSAYTMNINAQMNYWPAEVTNLPECHEPFFRLVKELAITGKETAQNMYGNPGWVAHHNTDIWRPTYPADNAVMYSYWPMGAGWLTNHLWEHYQFTEDITFLKEEAYPLLKGAAQFFSSWLVKNEEGYWVTPVGTSPENMFYFKDDETAYVSAGGTMDMAIVRENFESVINASKVLGIDHDFRNKLEAMVSELLPYKIGSKGQLQEWQYDFKEPDVHHRHLSHLYGFHPSNQISEDKTPDLFKAVKKTLELRGDHATGWSMGWKINFWARMHDGNHAYKIINNLFSFVDENDKHGGLYANLLDAHPPFQIDGNFGYTAGVAEMLLQSHTGTIHVLPALPNAWSTGSIKGLKARGNITVDIDWKDTKLVKVGLKSLKDQTLILRYGDLKKKVMVKAGEDYVFDLAAFH
ncbi:glycoside hydrolase N-terminal domain-containing protein [Mariniflexile gromovii]|uniref:Glycoside hydrolase family 95 protein n=1 Tax=Mariniflexile gromovii TaxID=362523 RepID=A0ABS4BTE8_9FLAO|nr:glycoside hydrolase family 95 protein [Mariniflexile gromovii]MBP0903832.1 glycoside hydrolase family 95 protein [Mariniflexile gromovii]